MAFDSSKLLQSFNPKGNEGGLLLALNAAGMVFAALSNTFAAATDKNTKAEDKKFLVPAGLATGVANIALYYGMTTKIIKKLAGKTLSPKKNETVQDLIKRKNLKDGTFVILKDEAGKEATVEVKGLAHKIIANLTEAQKNEHVFNKIEKAQKGGIFGFGKSNSEEIAGMVLEFLKPNSTFKNANDILNNKDAFINAKNVLSENGEKLLGVNVKAGMGVMGAFIGAVVGCAILTPIIRDVSAYFIQKRMERKNPELTVKPYRPYFDPTHTKVGENSLPTPKQPLSFKNYMTYTGSSLKV